MVVVVGGGVGLIVVGGCDCWVIVGGGSVGLVVVAGGGNCLVVVVCDGGGLVAVVVCDSDVGCFADLFCAASLVRLRTSPCFASIASFTALVSARRAFSDASTAFRFLVKSIRSCIISELGMGSLPISCNFCFNLFLFESPMADFSRSASTAVISGSMPRTSAGSGHLSKPSGGLIGNTSSLSIASPITAPHLSMLAYSFIIGFSVTMSRCAVIFFFHLVRASFNRTVF